MKKRLFTSLTCLALLSCGGAQRPAPKSDGVVDQKEFHRQQDLLIESHAKMLSERGRMPINYREAFFVLGRYGYHTAPDSYFGAYSFDRQAFQQAERSWWIDGIMKAGSDVLEAVNINAIFTEQVIGYRVDYISQLGHVDGARGRSLVYGNKDIRDAHVIGLVKYDDGSVGHSAVRLDVKSKVFARTYGIGILPPDYVDMCACYAPMLSPR